MKRYILILIVTYIGLQAQGDFEYMGESTPYPGYIESEFTEPTNNTDSLENLQDEVKDSLEADEPLNSQVESTLDSNKRANNAAFETTTFYIIIFCWLIYIIIYLNYFTFFQSLYNSFINARKGFLVFEELSYKENLPFVVLLLNSVFVYALFFMIVCNYYNVNWFENQMFATWILWSVLIVILFAAKQLVLFFLSKIIDFKGVLQFYGFNIQTIFIFSAIALLCIMSLIVFKNLSTVTLAVMAGLLILFQLFRIIRGVFIGRKQIIVHPFYFLLYLCTLEIIPILIIYKTTLALL